MGFGSPPCRRNSRQLAFDLRRCGVLSPTPVKTRQLPESAVSVLFPGPESGKTKNGSANENGMTDAESADERHGVIRCGETKLVWPNLCCRRWRWGTALGGVAVESAVPVR
jgi:hypothetical protein